MISRRSCRLSFIGRAVRLVGIAPGGFSGPLGQTRGVLPGSRRADLELGRGLREGPMRGYARNRSACCPRFNFQTTSLLAFPPRYEGEVAPTY